MKSIKIAVIDGKGGGIGKSIIQTLRGMDLPAVTILALGTNSHATYNMLSGGADDGATGENAVCYMVEQVDIIIGPIAIMAANSMMGEFSPAMASSIASSSAHKILLPLNRCGITVVGVAPVGIKEMMQSIPAIVNDTLAEIQ